MQDEFTRHQCRLRANDLALAEHATTSTPERDPAIVPGVEDREDIAKEEEENGEGGDDLFSATHNISHHRHRLVGPAQRGVAETEEEEFQGTAGIGEVVVVVLFVIVRGCLIVVLLFFVVLV